MMQRTVAPVASFQHRKSACEAEEVISEAVRPKM